MLKCKKELHFEFFKDHRQKSSLPSHVGMFQYSKVPTYCIPTQKQYLLLRHGISRRIETQRADTHNALREGGV